MTEFEKMRREEFYDFTSEECLSSYYGVTICDRCIIGAGSVVVKDIPSDSIAVGNPCRVIRKTNENR